MDQTIKISFYPLNHTDPDAQLLFACRLTEKARRLNHRIHLHTATIDQANRLDELLWQFRPESFLPHVNIDDGNEEITGPHQITLGIGINLPDKPEVLVNLAPTIWESHTVFSDIREIVTADESGRDFGRQRYRQYQNLGYFIETLK